MWWYVVLWVVAIVAAVVMMPKPQNAKPAGFSEVQVPTAEVGREIPVLFGERDIRGPNVCWYGDFRAIPIKKKGGKK